MRYTNLPRPNHISNLHVSNTLYEWVEVPGLGGAYGALPPEQQYMSSIRRPSRAREHNFIEMYDHKARTFPHMQDCIRTTGNHGYSVGEDEQELLYVPIVRADGLVCAYHADYLYHGCFEGHGLEPDLTIGSAERMYRELDPPITKSATVTRNPVDTEFSLWFLLVDIKEFPKLITSIFTLVRSLRKLRFSSTMMNLPYNDWMSSQLAFDYGLKPSLQDLGEFVHLIKKWGSLIDYRNYLTNEIYTAHKPVREIEPPKLYERTFLFHEEGARATLNMRYVVGAKRLYQTTKYYFVAPELHGLLATIKAAADRLGLNDVFAAAWDIVPFSFVIDWVVDIGGWLHKNLKPNWYPVDLVVSDWAESFIRESTYEGDLTYEAPGPFGTFYGGTRGPVSFTKHNFVRGVFNQYARRRQFDKQRLVIVRDSVELRFKRTICRLNRVIDGSCIVGTRAIAKSRSQPSRYMIRHRR
jgi:hypothetical protein